MEIKNILFIFVIFTSVSLINASSFGYDNPNLPKLLKVSSDNLTNIVHNNTVNYFTQDNHFSNIFLDKISRNQKIHLEVTNQNDYGGVYWTLWADADNSIIGNKVVSLWGYPKNASNGLPLAYEDFFTCTFADYVENPLSYTKQCYFNSNIKTKLTGTGNAYACIDANGLLYRSATPCV